MVNFHTIGFGVGVLIIGFVLLPLIMSFSPADTLEGFVISAILILAGILLLIMGARDHEVR